MEEPQGCEYREHEGQSRCHKLCELGQTLCPYHRLLIQQTGAELNTITQTYQTPRAYRE